MPRRSNKLPQYVQVQITRHGKKVFYFRRGRGEENRTRLPMYGSPEFEAAYAGARAGAPIPVVSKRQASGETVKWLIDLYRASPAWAVLKPATRKGRETVLDHLMATVGDRLIDDLTREEIERRMATKTVSMANLTLNTLRTMFTWAIEAKHVDENPAAAVRYLKKVRTDLDAEIGHKTWTEDDLTRYEAAYPVGTLQRHVYDWFLSSGLRVGDMSRLGSQHVDRKDGTIQIRTEKTGKAVYLPPLQRGLNAGPHDRRPGELAFITGKRGRAWGKAHLGAQLAKFAKEAGLVDCTAHGLRKAAAVRCAEGGATVKEMMARFGWKRPEMAIKYCDRADDKKLALEAAKKGVREETGNSFLPSPDNKVRA